MKLLLITNDPVQGSALADGLKSLGHMVVRAWSAGEAVLLIGTARPTLAIIDRCHGNDPEAPRLANYLVEQHIGVLWLGTPAGLAATVSDVLVAELGPPCDPASVVGALEALAQWHPGALAPTHVPRLTILTT